MKNDPARADELALALALEISNLHVDPGKNLTVRLPLSLVLRQ